MISFVVKLDNNHIGFPITIDYFIRVFYSQRYNYFSHFGPREKPIIPDDQYEHPLWLKEGQAFFMNFRLTIYARTKTISLLYPINEFFIYPESLLQISFNPKNLAKTSATFLHHSISPILLYQESTLNCFSFWRPPNCLLRLKHRLKKRIKNEDDSEISQDKDNPNHQLI